MTRTRTLSLFLAAGVLLWGALALPQSAAGPSVEASVPLSDALVAGSAVEKGLEELELDDPLAPEPAATLPVAKSDLHKPVEHFRTASAVEPDAPVPLPAPAKACQSTGADAPRASEVIRVLAS